MLGIGRREFITLLGGGVAAWPLVARAQQGGPARRIGVLTGLAEDDPETQARLTGFRQGLERFGWSDGGNVRIHYRFAAASAEQARVLAKELVALQPDLILAHSDPISTALQRESRAIPIVFVGISDPVAAGFVASLPRPGGNLTGLMQFEASITGKWLAMLKEIAPRLARAALVKNTKTNDYEHFMRAAEGVAPSLAIELVSSHVEKPADIARAIESLARVPDGGLVVLPDPTTLVHRDLIIALAARYRLPAVYSGRHFVVAGGLMSYGINRVDEFRQAASYVDRILRGDKPADLPVLAPTKYETVLSLKVAKIIGLEVPPSLLVRADEVIE
jgi:putative tryptophan/tyrosine transport system substrate-binding protein